jgi:hypothetical protein
VVVKTGRIGFIDIAKSLVYITGGHGSVYVTDIGLTIEKTPRESLDLKGKTV